MRAALREYKTASADRIAGYCIPVAGQGAVRGRLRPVTADSLRNEEEMRLMAEWRQAAGVWFATQFPLSVEGTRQWIERQVLPRDDRILFLVEDETHLPIGQIGLLHYDEEKKECEFDNLLRGRKGSFGNLMIYAMLALGEWSLRVLDLQRAYVHVLGDNHRAMAIYKRLGFEEAERIPLVKHSDGDVLRWVNAEMPWEKAEREMVKMQIERDVYLRTLREGMR